MVGIGGQGISRKKYQTLSKVLRRKVRGCIFVQCCGSFYRQIWKITVWSNRGLLFIHGRSTANIQGKTKRPAAVTKQMALRNPKSHESYPQCSPYTGRKRHIGRMSITLFWQPVATVTGKHCHELGCKQPCSPAHTRLISKLWIL